MRVSRLWSAAALAGLGAALSSACSSSEGGSTSETDASTDATGAGGSSSGSSSGGSSSGSSGGSSSSGSSSGAVTDGSSGADTGTLADASPDAGTLQTLCVALIGAACGGGGPQTVGECVSISASSRRARSSRRASRAQGRLRSQHARLGRGAQRCRLHLRHRRVLRRRRWRRRLPRLRGHEQRAEFTGTTSPGNPMVIASSGLATPIIFWGPAQAGGYGEPSGYEELSGLAPGESVAARIVTLGSSHCGTTGCPADIEFVVGPFDAGTPTVIASTGSACGQALLTADGAGNIFFSAGKTGDSGVAENNVGLLFLQSVGDAAADATDGSHDAATDGN